MERQTKSLLRCLCLASCPQAKTARCKGHRSSVFDRNALFSAVILLIFFVFIGLLLLIKSKFWVCQTASRFDHLKTLNIQHLFDFILKQILSWSVIWLDEDMERIMYSAILAHCTLTSSGKPEVTTRVFKQIKRAKNSLSNEF